MKRWIALGWIVIAAYCTPALATSPRDSRAPEDPAAEGCVASGSCVEIVWLGNTNWCFKYQGGTILMDTNLGPDGLRALESAGCRDVEAIFVGHNHRDHNRGFRSLARTLRAPVIAMRRAATPEFEARTGRAFVLRSGLKATALAVEHSNEVPRLMGFGGPDPFGYVLEFPLRDEQSRPITFFWTDTSTTMGLRNNPVDGLDYPKLTRAVIEQVGKPITLWFTFFGINHQIFAEFNAILHPRFYVVHHLGPPNPNLMMVFDQPFDPRRAGLENTVAEFGSAYVPLGDFFSTYEIRSDSAVRVERGFARKFRGR